jgi:hypothetical protein
MGILLYRPVIVKKPFPESRIKGFGLRSKSLSITNALEGFSTVIIRFATKERKEMNNDKI